MSTRRQFISTTAIAAVAASAPVRALEPPPPAASTESLARGQAPADELKRYNTLAAVAQSVPFPES
ncbi:MAG: hypothetical protein OEU54_14250 [Gemmatimonadota bacterium]|nr:hypothetical protein [Gemmatimonadota bacterium]